ncbi:MAG: SBBP repeat-containing protein [Pyrinomonadaceae bacterium]|nr:SBBP repeat-containing protein [Pyrinomonadaceae bacterium]
MKSTRTSTHYLNIFALVLLTGSSLSLLVASFAPTRPSAPSSLITQDLRASSLPSTTDLAREAYGRMELSFEANRGQTDASVNFLARGAGYTLFLKPTEAVFQLRGADSGSSTGNAVAPSSNPKSEIRNPKSAVLRMKLIGADAGAAVEGAQELAGKVNYFNGNDPAQWRTEVPTFARVRYGQVYPGIDVVYYGNQRQLEYDFVVAPGRDADAIKIEFDGADKVTVDRGGDLLLTLGKSVIRQPKPVVYQEVAGLRRAIDGGYSISADGEVGFTIGEYDAQRALIIDPVLVYSTYLGGSGNESARDITVDAAGNAYICGQTNSTNFPTANAFDATFNTGNIAADRDAFVTKINAAGTALVYSTYLGGTGNSINLSGDDLCTGIAIDSAGNAYLAGETRSTDFPTANALQGTFGGGLFEGFLTKLNAAGSALVYSTYIGGNTFDSAASVVVDSSGNAYVAGRTTSTNFATVNPIQAAFAGGGSDAFIMKLNAAGSAIVYSTYLGGGGGNGFDATRSIALDPANNLYIIGATLSTDFPTANPIQATYGGGTDGDAFVAKINAAGSALVYSTYLGGSGSESPQDMTVDSSGNAYFTGGTDSSNFPTANAFDAILSGTSDAFVTKLNAAGSAFVYSTYLGGGAGDGGNDIALDSSGNAYVAGFTASTDFPTVNPTQAANAGGSNDAFVAKLNAAGAALLFSTYLGGSGGDSGFAIAVDSAGNAYVAGITTSTNFPTLNPVQAANAGGDDAFLTKINPAIIVATTFQFSQATHPVFEDVTSITVTVTRTGDASGAGTVDYGTADGTATERADYTTSLGTLRFAGGETSKTFDVLVNEDSKVEGNEAFTVALSNPTGGASLGAQSTTTVQIMDDVVEPTTNVIDDAGIFVGTHYHDFLNRQADAPGQAFWTGQITSCGSEAGCIDNRRTSVSTAFFVSIEFQQTGYLVFRFYKETFTDSVGRPRGMPRYREFLRDTQEIGRGVVVGVGNWETQLETNKQDFAQRWVQKAEFIAEFPGTMTAAQFVDKLFLNSETTPTTAERNAAIAAFGAGDVAGRAAALRSVADSGSVYNRQYNAAFVLIQYIGYLRRNPNDAPEAGLNYAGYDFWLTKMNNHSVAGEDVRNEQVALARVQRAEMVRAFIISGEYRGRFGP